MVKQVKDKQDFQACFLSGLGLGATNPSNSDNLILTEGE